MSTAPPRLAPIFRSDTQPREVNVTVLSLEEWERAGTGFLTHLKTQPLVTLDVVL